jgi:hypothetical protein
LSAVVNDPNAPVETSANEQKFKTGVDWITNVSAFGFSLAAGLTAGIGKVILSWSYIQEYRGGPEETEEALFVYLPVATVIAFLWYLLWLYGTTPEPAGRQKKLGRTFAVINGLLLWAVAAGLDIGNPV